MNVTATVRRADIAKILIKRGFVVKDIIDDPDFHWSTNFIFDATPEFLQAADDTMKLLHLSADDPKIHRGNKRHENTDKRNNTSNTLRGGYSKDTKVTASDIKDERPTTTEDTQAETTTVTENTATTAENTDAASATGEVKTNE